MLNRVMCSVLGVVCLAGSAQAAPDLSASYAKPLWMQTAVVVRTELAQDDSDKPDAEVVDERDAFTAPPIGEPTSSRSLQPGEVAPPEVLARMRDAYDRGRRLHRIGNITTVVGGVVFFPLALSTIVSTWSGNGGLTVILGLGTFGAAGAYYTGGFLSSLGAFNATRAVNAAFGTDITTGFAIGGMVSSSAGVLLTPFVLGGFAPIVGIICGVVQLQQVKRALEELGVSDFQIAPTPQGFAMSLRF